MRKSVRKEELSITKKGRWEINSNEGRLHWMRKAVPLAFLFGIILSFRLWTSDRTFPLLPWLDFFYSFPIALDYILIFVLISLLCINFFIWNRRFNLFTVFILTVILIQDQNRWQPWVYIYFIFFLLFSIKGKDNRDTKDLILLCRIVMIGIYFWSGVHKLNSGFIHETFTSILIELLWFKDENSINSAKPFGYLAPIIEITISFSLLFPRWRNVGVYLAIITHGFIILYLSPLGVNSNTVVYPWNVAMLVFVVLLFYRSKDKIAIARSNKPDLITIVVIGLIYIMPTLNFLGWWDHYLSFSLYSHQTDKYYVVLAEQELGKIDIDLDQYYLKIEGLEGGKIIDVSKWCQDELNVPFYPESRTFKILAKEFCQWGIKGDQVYFLEMDAKEEIIYKRYTCNDLSD